MKNILHLVLFTVLLFTACDNGGGETLEDPVISLENVSQFEGNEGATTFSFSIKIDKASDKEISFSYETRDDDAKAGEDYTATSGTGKIAVGETQTTIDVTVSGDRDVEENEKFEFLYGKRI